MVLNELSLISSDQVPPESSTLSLTPSACPLREIEIYSIARAFKSGSAATWTAFFVGN